MFSVIPADLDLKILSRDSKRLSRKERAGYLTEFIPAGIEEGNV